MLDILIQQIFHMEFSDGTLLILLNFKKNNFVNEIDLTSFKFTAIIRFFKSLQESAKCKQKIPCGQTDESKHLAYRHILETVVKVLEEKFKIFVFFINLIQVH